MNKGDDGTIQFSFINSAGAAVDISVYVGMTIDIFQEDRKILASYSLETLAGHRDITVTNASLGLIQIYVPRSISEKMRNSPLFADLTICKVDLSAESGKFCTSVLGVELPKVKIPVRIKEVEMP